MALEIITRPCRQRKPRVSATCPWCSRKVLVEKKSTLPCACGALHRWNGSTLYHVPKVK